MSPSLDKWKAVEVTIKWILLLNEGYGTNKIKFLSLVKMRLLHQLAHYTKKEGGARDKAAKEGSSQGKVNNYFWFIDLCKKIELVAEQAASFLISVMNFRQLLTVRFLQPYCFFPASLFFVLLTISFGAPSEGWEGKKMLCLPQGGSGVPGLQPSSGLSQPQA